MSGPSREWARVNDQPLTEWIEVRRAEGHRWDMIAKEIHTTSRGVLDFDAWSLRRWYDLERAS